MLTAKTCAACMLPIPQPAYKMTMKAWDARRFCSHACAHDARIRKPAPAPSKPCLSCGTAIFKRSSDGARWQTRKACSSACASKLRITLLPMTCPGCGDQFQPSTKRAKFCGRRCAASAHTGPLMVKGKPERYVRITNADGRRVLAHRHVMEQKLGRKLVPGETVHHKNGDKRDNTATNLELWWKGQPAGQRVEDLIAYIASHHAGAMRVALGKGVA